MFCRLPLSLRWGGGMVWDCISGGEQAITIAISEKRILSGAHRHSQVGGVFEVLQNHALELVPLHRFATPIVRVHDIGGGEIHWENRHEPIRQIEATIV